MLHGVPGNSDGPQVWTSVNEEIGKVCGNIWSSLSDLFNTKLTVRTGLPRHELSRRESPGPGDCACCHNSSADEFSVEAFEEELDSMAKHESREDRIFQEFKTKIALEPEGKRE